MSHRVTSTDHTKIAAPEAEVQANWLALVGEKVGALQYGVVQITVHDGRVVQVELTERHRFQVRQSA